MERLRPGARQRDLADRGRRLAVLQLERALAQARDMAPERDRPGGHDQHVRAARVQRRDVGDERVEPVLLQGAARVVDQQRRADLDDDARELVEGGQLRHGRRGIGEYDKIVLAVEQPRR